MQKNRFAKAFKESLTKEAIPVYFNPPPQQPPAQVQSIAARPSGNPSNYGSKLTIPKEQETVIACLILEAGGEGKTGMEAVYEVIKNRSTAQHKSMYQIVTAPKQFSCFNAGVDAAVAKAKKHKLWNIAASIIKSPATNHTKGAVYYHTTAINPWWAPKLLTKGAKTTTIGHHIFYYKI